MENNNLTELWAPVLRDNVRTTFEALSDSDVERIDGNIETFIQVLGERYGYAPEHAESEIDAFMRKYNTFDNSAASEAFSNTAGEPSGEVF